MTLLAEGMSLKDGSSVLAKIVAAHTNASMCIEREAHLSVHGDRPTRLNVTDSFR